VISFIRRYVFHQFWLKVISLAVAALLWLAVARDPVAEVAVSVPIEFHHVPEGLEISSETIPQAQVRVRGPASIVRTLSDAEIHTVIDLQGARSGERTYDLTASQVRVPHDVEVVQVVPTQLRLSFDERTTRLVPVQPRVIGTFASGIHISQISVKPEQIAIAGPRKRVNAVETAITDPVDASGVVGHATFTTHAFVPDPLVRIMRPEPIRVTVATEKTGGPASAGRN
jgi:YbbR domain-containing protein